MIWRAEQMKMNELEVLKKTVSKQANRIASLALDLDLAYAQIELLNEEIEKLKSQKNDTK